MYRLKRLNLRYFCQSRAPGDDINQSALGANLDGLGRYVTFFVSLEAMSYVGRTGVPLTGVIQERRLSNARNGPMNFS
jgi:hypothetical protein